MVAMMKIAKALRDEDPKKNTQAKIAARLGVGQQTVSDWFGTNTGPGNTSVPDARVKIPPKERPLSVKWGYCQGRSWHNWRECGPVYDRENQIVRQIRKMLLIGLKQRG
jgi:hypothetical protein